MDTHTSSFARLRPLLMRMALRVPADDHEAQAVVDLADDLTTMLVIMLERVSPEARVAYVLHDLFGAELPEVACLMGKGESACLVLVDQAKAQLLAARPSRPRVRIP